MSTRETHGDWIRHEWVGTAADFHAKEIGGGRAIWNCVVTEPSIVLGSAQAATDIDLANASSLGLTVAQRRSGGGAVYVHSDDSIWIDVTIPRDDPLWVDDVSGSMLWLGDALVRALSPWVNATTYRGTFVSGQDGRTVCFASIAPGEVMVDQHKLVGISQRRGRNGARFQCVVYRYWFPNKWTPALVSGDVRDRVNNMAVATVEVSASELVDALLEVLSSPTL